MEWERDFEHCSHGFCKADFMVSLPWNLQNSERVSWFFPFHVAICGDKLMVNYLCSDNTSVRTSQVTTRHGPWRTSPVQPVHRCRIWAWIEWWRIRCRVRKACHLLEKGADPVEACDASGWGVNESRGELIWVWVMDGHGISRSVRSCGIMYYHVISKDLQSILGMDDFWYPSLLTSEAIARPHGCGTWFRAKASGVSSNAQCSWAGEELPPVVFVVYRNIWIAIEV